MSNPNGTASVARGKVKGKTAIVPVYCRGTGGMSCSLVLQLTVTEIFRGHRLVAVTTSTKQGSTLVLGRARATLDAGQNRTVKITLTGAGKRLLVKRHRLKVKLRVTQVLAGTSSVRAAVKLVSTQALTF